MTLSESAEKGRITARTAALFCSIGAVLSLLTLDIPLALVGFWVSGGIRKGNYAARNIGVLLRTADIFVMAITGLAVWFAGAPDWLWTLLAAAAGLMLFIDIWSIAVLKGSGNLKQYFREVNEGTSPQDESDNGA
ncbi:MAG: hypothetical protein NC395_08080 [Prevotella sp.]|nr:hypothetical protein [Prevotella sp.]